MLKNEMKKTCLNFLENQSKKFGKILGFKHRSRGKENNSIKN